MYVLHIIEIVQEDAGSNSIDVFNPFKHSEVRCISLITYSMCNHKCVRNDFWQSGKSCNKDENSDCSESSNILVYHFNKASKEL